MPSNYDQLHGLHLLRAARSRMQLVAASRPSARRALFQCVELGLLNVADLLHKAAAELTSGDAGRAAVCLGWSRGFHGLLIRLVASPARLPVCFGFEPGRTWPTHSPGVAAYLASQRVFEQVFSAWLREHEEEAAGALSHASLDQPLSSLVHWLRIGNHEATIWERGLTGLSLPADVTSYTDFIGADQLAAAVAASGHDRTFLTQFRGLHQIPETLAEEANDHLERAILSLRDDGTTEAVDHLQLVNHFVDLMLSAAETLVDHLCTADYHAIRDQLQSMTSGVHSVAIHYHLFGDLYQQLVEEVCRVAGGEAAPSEGSRHAVAAQCWQLRGSIRLWRDEHFHWPRNHLGSLGTRSLIGSLDALATADRFRQVMPHDERLCRLADRLGLGGQPGPPGPVQAWMEDPRSLDAAMLRLTGEIARERYPEVQTRTGPYGGESGFRPPPRRSVRERGEPSTSDSTGATPAPSSPTQHAP